MNETDGDWDMRGVVVPILTPLRPDGEVDVASLRRLTNYVIGGGVHGIWAAGTTGEFAALDEPARRLVIETVVEEAAGRVPVIGNVSAPATRATIAAAEALRDCPVTGVAATPPYYYSNTQDELLDHFRAIADRSAQPLWVYNIPSTVKVTVEPDTIAALAADGTVAGVKDSSGGGESFAPTRHALPEPQPRPVPVRRLRVARHHGRYRGSRNHPRHRQPGAAQRVRRLGGRPERR